MKKRLTITFCGAPNVGKSTLLNKLLDCKVAICCAKPQTTRYNIKGILTKNDTQLIFIDTPGIFRPKLSQLEKQIVKEAWQGFCGTDLICVIIDGKKGLDKSALTILDKTKTNGIPIIGIINKSDLLTMDEKVLLANKINETGRVVDIFSLSAKTGKGCNELIKYFIKNAKQGDWFYSEDDITDKDNNFLAAEFVREQLFKFLNKEIPYMLECETEFYEDNGEEVNISVVVKIGKSNHKKMIIGKDGRNLKKIIHNTSVNLENLLGKKVALKIFIKFVEKK